MSKHENGELLIVKKPRSPLSDEIHTEVRLKNGKMAGLSSIVTTFRVLKNLNAEELRKLQELARAGDEKHFNDHAQAKGTHSLCKSRLVRDILVSTTKCEDGTFTFDKPTDVIDPEWVDHKLIEEIESRLKVFESVRSFGKVDRGPGSERW